MQEKHASHKAFRDHFNNWVDVIVHCGGTIVDCEDVEGELSYIPDFSNSKHRENYTGKAKCKDKLLGVVYLMCVDLSQFRKLLEDKKMLT